MKRYVKLSTKFSFTLVTIEAVKIIINGLLKNKSISGRILLNVCQFPVSLKPSDIVLFLRKRTPEVDQIFDKLAFYLSMRKNLISSMTSELFTLRIS